MSEEQSMRDVLDERLLAIRAMHPVVEISERAMLLAINGDNDEKHLKSLVEELGRLEPRTLSRLLEYLDTVKRAVALMGLSKMIQGIAIDVPKALEVLTGDHKEEESPDE